MYNTLEINKDHSMFTILIDEVREGLHGFPETSIKDVQVR